MIGVGLTAVFAMASAGAAGAEETGQWRLTGNAGNVVVAYDVGSIQRSGSIVTVRSIFAMRQTETLSPGGTRYDYRLSQSRFDCDQGTGTELHVGYYSLESETKVFENSVPSSIQRPEPELASGSDNAIRL